MSASVESTRFAGCATEGCTQGDCPSCVEIARLRRSLAARVDDVARSRSYTAEEFGPLPPNARQENVWVKAVLHVAQDTTADTPVCLELETLGMCSHAAGDDPIYFDCRAGDIRVLGDVLAAVIGAAERDGVLPVVRRESGEGWR